MSPISADSISACANCGKGGEGDNDIQLKTCTACKLVKYCSRECQAAHRPQHKKECKKLAAELHDEALFKQPPPLDDFPICFIRMPLPSSGRKYQICCAPTADVMEDMLIKRVEKNDIAAMYNLGCVYYRGMYNFPQNHAKKFDLWHRAGELGSAMAYASVGCTYHEGTGVEKDMKKAIHYWELAAIGGDARARHFLGNYEHNKGNMDRALKHWIISVGGGYVDSLKHINRLFIIGRATKDDYEKALRAHKAYLDEIKSDQRDIAAAFSDKFKYYY